MKLFSVATVFLFFSVMVFSAAAGTPKLPKGLKWETNDRDAVYASSKAIKGGSFRMYMPSFPLTLRHFGPDSNGSFRSYLDSNRMGLTERHPNTDKIIPSIATYWAHGKDNKTVYYKLNKNAKWSDGKPVTADDFVFNLKLMRSKHIVAPWYNNHYTEHFDKIIKYDDHTIAVVGNIARSNDDLHYYNGIEPAPKHFYAPYLNKDFVKHFNWLVAPNLGPYAISEIRKGKYITFKRKKNWWAKDLKYNKNRYNVDKVKIVVIRDNNVAFEHFKKGKLDGFALTLPEYWHKKSRGKIFDRGYVKKLWFYVDCPQPNYGMWLNQDYPLFKDINVRKAFGHAMNVEKVLKTVLRGDYERLHASHTGYGEFTNKKIRARKYDLKKVDEYLKKAGWSKFGDDGIRVKNGERLSVTVTYGAPHHQDRLVIIKEEAKKAGIELKLKLLDSATSFKVMLEKKHQIAWSGWSASYKPSYWQGLHSDNAHKPQTNNFSNTDNKKLDKLIMKYRNEFNDSKKAAMSREIQKMEYEQGAYIPTFMVPYFRGAYWRYWKFPKTPATKKSDTIFGVFDYGLFWLDKDLKKELKKAKKNGKKYKIETSINKTFKV